MLLVYADETKIISEKGVDSDECHEGNCHIMVKELLDLEEQLPVLLPELVCDRTVALHLVLKGSLLLQLLFVHLLNDIINGVVHGC